MSDTDKDIWISPEETAEKYPYYTETLQRLHAVLSLAQKQGVTDPEITSLCASLHAFAIARLRPNDQRMEHCVAIFRRAVAAFIADADKLHG